MKYIKSIFLFLTLPFIYCTGQTLDINGKIIDGISRKSIPGVHVYLDKSKGATTDLKGNFKLKTNNLKSDSLYISCIGYKKLALSIKRVKKNRVINIYPDTICLNTVKVNGKKSDPKKILKKVLKNIKNNYSTTPYNIEAFYRSYTKTDSMYVKYKEVAFNAHLSRYNKIDCFKVNSNRAWASAKVNPYSWNGNFFYCLQQGELLNFKRHIYTRPFSPYDLKIDSVYYKDNNLVYVIEEAKMPREYVDTLESNIVSYNEDGYYHENLIKSDTIIKHDKNVISKIKIHVILPEYAVIKIERDFTKMMTTEQISSILYSEKQLRELIGRNETIIYKKINGKWFEHKHFVYTEAIHSGKYDYKNRGFIKKEVSEFYTNEYDFKQQHLDKYISSNGFWSTYETKDMKLKEIVNHDEKFWSEYKYLINDSLKTKVLEEIEKNKVYFKSED